MPLERLAFKMQLKTGYEAEYKKRHDELWPEMIDLLKHSGIAHYSIFHDPETNILFAYMLNDSSSPTLQTVANPVVERWWKHMSDIMEVNDDLSPVQKPLTEVFYLQ